MSTDIALINSSEPVRPLPEDFDMHPSHTRRFASRHTAAPSFRPCVESLEGREMPALLMVSAPHLPTAITVVEWLRRGHVTPLIGQVSGTWSAQATAGGTTQTLSGMGSVNPLGSVSATGTLNISAATANGTFVLTNSKGSITVHLSGQAPMPDFVPATLTYSIIGGTGAYAGDSGVGVAHLRERPEYRPPPPPPGQVGPDFIIAASFSLTFSE
jgi:hypothetical protein